MFYNHLFWMAIALFLCAAININAYLEYHKTIRILPSIIGLAGLFGLVGWTIRLFSLAMTFNWWWMVGIGGSSWASQPPLYCLLAFWPISLV